MSDGITRRTFLAAAGGAAALAAIPAVAAAKPARPMICVFSKHLQYLSDYDKLAEECSRLGLDGVDLTVRDEGHVLPQRVTEDLPRAVAAIRAQGLEVPMITTRLKDGTEPEARPILEAAAEQGIKYVRIGGHKYSPQGNPLQRLDACARDMQALVSLLDEFDLYAGYHNHSGELNVGAPVWDLHYLFGKIGSPRIGSNYDIGHAMVEGSYGDWQITTRLMAPLAKMASIKDFVWKGNAPAWIPLGEGIVPLAPMLRILREANFAGPVSMHFEYKIERDESTPEHIAADLKMLRSAMIAAGYAE